MNYKLLTLILIALVTFPLVSGSLYYSGESRLEGLQVNTELNYLGNKALANTTASFLISNLGESQEQFTYSFKLYGQTLKSEQISLSASESKRVKLMTAQELEGPRYVLHTEPRLLLNGKQIGKELKQADFEISFPEQSTILYVDPKLTTKEHKDYKWSFEDKYPVLDIDASWIRQDVNISLRRNLSNHDLELNDTVEITYSIHNHDNKSYEGTLNDLQSHKVFKPFDNSKFKSTPSQDPTSFPFLIYRENISLGPKEEETRTAKLKVRGSSYSGNFRMKGFPFLIPEVGFKQRSNIINFSVNPCNYNEVCEPERGENYLNCIKDCPSGSSDGLCDGLIDGKCDPDCEASYDPDCKLEGAERAEEEPLQKREFLSRVLDDPYLLGVVGLAILLIITYLVGRKHQFKS